MDGNRGAKGSIKDRIISMLYRKRYNNKKLKEDDYSVYKKKQQEEYLKKLKNFNENENIYVLNKSDKEKVESIKVSGTFEPPNYETKKTNYKKSIDKPATKVNTYTFVSFPKGINPKGIAIDSFTKNDKININKELNKTKDEIAILTEVNTFINRSKEYLNSIERQVEDIKTEVKNKNQDTLKIEEKYNKLKNQIDKLKLQYDSIKNKYDLSEFRIFESIKVIKNIDNYKSIANLNEIEMMVRVCKKELSSIKNVEAINEENNKFGSTINQTKEEHKSIKIKFKKAEDKVKELDLLEDKIKSELEKQQSIVDEMYDKVSYIDETIVKTKEYVGKTKLLSSIFKITAGMLTFSLSKKKIFGFALGATLVNKGLKELNKSYEVKERIRVDVKYEDLTKALNDVSDKISYTSLVLTDCLTEIEKLKYNFTNEYKEYSSVIPNYNESIKQIMDLEISIKENQKKLQSIDGKLKYEKEENQKELRKVFKIKEKY